MGGAWGATGGVGLYRTVADRWPECADDLTGMMRSGVAGAVEHYDAHVAAMAENRRIQLNEAMAALFAQVDFVLCAANPSTAFDADGRLPTEFGGLEAKASNNGALTIPGNIYGNPGVSVPIGQASDGLPVGLQVMAPHFKEQLLLDLALVAEAERPWPLVAPTA
jgi:aspartyl-tRNA(Asn)/glutamyl-tRNA(Gln) amidotransferase subunit A